MIQLSGELFDTDIGGWNQGVAPEAYVPVQRLVKIAKEKNLTVRTWIMVSDEVRKFPTEHKRVCKYLGYSYKGSVAPWKYPPKEKTRQVNGLEEAQVVTRSGQL